jgi:hypothetical protein
MGGCESCASGRRKEVDRRIDDSKLTTLTTGWRLALWTSHGHGTHHPHGPHGISLLFCSFSFCFLFRLSGWSMMPSCVLSHVSIKTDRVWGTETIWDEWHRILLEQRVTQNSPSAQRVWCSVSFLFSAAWVLWGATATVATSEMPSARSRPALPKFVPKLARKRTWELVLFYKGLIIGG